MVFFFVASPTPSVAEAGMLPGIAYYMSRWYTKDELVFRLALYIVMAPLAGGECYPPPFCFSGLWSRVLTLCPLIQPSVVC